MAGEGGREAEREAEGEEAGVGEMMVTGGEGEVVVQMTDTGEEEEEEGLREGVEVGEEGIGMTGGEVEIGARGVRGRR